MNAICVRALSDDSKNYVTGRLNNYVGTLFYLEKL